MSFPSSRGGFDSRSPLHSERFISVSGMFFKAILSELDKYIPEGNPRKWAKLSNDIDFRRLQLTLLKEILIELKQINAK